MLRESEPSLGASSETGTVLTDESVLMETGEASLLELEEKISDLEAPPRPL